MSVARTIPASVNGTFPACFAHGECGLEPACGVAPRVVRDEAAKAIPVAAVHGLQGARGGWPDDPYFSHLHAEAIAVTQCDVRRRPTVHGRPWAKGYDGRSIPSILQPPAPVQPKAQSAEDKREQRDGVSNLHFNDLLTHQCRPDCAVYASLAGGRQ